MNEQNHQERKRNEAMQSIVLLLQIPMLINMLGQSGRLPDGFVVVGNEKYF